MIVNWTSCFGSFVGFSTSSSQPLPYLGDLWNKNSILLNWNMHFDYKKNLNKLFFLVPRSKIRMLHIFFIEHFFLIIKSKTKLSIMGWEKILVFWYFLKHLLHNKLKHVLFIYNLFKTSASSMSILNYLLIIWKKLEVH